MKNYSRQAIESFETFIGFYPRGSLSSSGNDCQWETMGLQSVRSEITPVQIGSHCGSSAGKRALIWLRKQTLPKIALTSASRVVKISVIALVSDFRFYDGTFYGGCSRATLFASQFVPRSLLAAITRVQLLCRTGIINLLRHELRKAAIIPTSKFDCYHANSGFARNW